VRKLSENFGKTYHMKAVEDSQYILTFTGFSFQKHRNIKFTGCGLLNMALSHIIVWDYPVAFSTILSQEGCEV
jgi:hypothetical protein